MNWIESKTKYGTIEKGEIFIKKNKRNNKENFILVGICISFVINLKVDEITISFFTKNSIISPFSTRTEKGISVLNYEALTNLSTLSLYGMVL